MQISRFIARDSRLSLLIASFAITVGETIFSLANVLLPQEDAIFVGTPWSHMLCKPYSQGSISFELRVTVMNPFIDYPNQRERGLSRDMPSLLFYRFFRTIFVHSHNSTKITSKGHIYSRVFRFVMIPSYIVGPINVYNWSKFLIDYSRPT